MTEQERVKLIQALAKAARELIRPVDFEDLEAKGVLKKEGAWYGVRDFKSVPKDFWAKAQAMAQDSKGIKIKLAKATKRTEALARKIKKLA